MEGYEAELVSKLGTDYPSQVSIMLSWNSESIFLKQKKRWVVGGVGGSGGIVKITFLD